MSRTATPCHLEEIKRQVKEGTYNIDPAAVADSILSHADRMVQAEFQDPRNTKPFGSFHNPRERFWTYIPWRT